MQVNSSEGLGLWELFELFRRRFLTFVCASVLIFFSVGLSFWLANAGRAHEIEVKFAPLPLSASTFVRLEHIARKVPVEQASGDESEGKDPSTLAAFELLSQIAAKQETLDFTAQPPFPGDGAKTPSRPTAVVVTFKLSSTDLSQQLIAIFAREMLTPAAVAALWDELVEEYREQFNQANDKTLSASAEYHILLEQYRMLLDSQIKAGRDATVGASTLQNPTSLPTPSFETFEPLANWKLLLAPDAVGVVKRAIFELEALILAKEAFVVKRRSFLSKLESQKIGRGFSKAHLDSWSQSAAKDGIWEGRQAGIIAERAIALQEKVFDPDNGTM